MSNNGRRCKKRTCKSPYCWIHLKYKLGYRIRPSQLPGAGDGLWYDPPIKQKVIRGRRESYQDARLRLKLPANTRIPNLKYIAGEREDETTRAVIDRRYRNKPPAEYVFCDEARDKILRPRDPCVDGYKTNSSFARYINNKSGKKRNNIRSSGRSRNQGPIQGYKGYTGAIFPNNENPDEGKLQFNFRTLGKSIMPGTEIKFNYGSNYELNV